MHWDLAEAANVELGGFSYPSIIIVSALLASHSRAGSMDVQMRFEDHYWFLNKTIRLGHYACVCSAMRIAECDAYASSRQKGPSPLSQMACTGNNGSTHLHAEVIISYFAKVLIQFK